MFALLSALPYLVTATDVLVDIHDLRMPSPHSADTIRLALESKNKQQLVVDGVELVDTTGEKIDMSAMSLRDLFETPFLLLGLRSLADKYSPGGVAVPTTDMITRAIQEVISEREQYREYQNTTLAPLEESTAEGETTTTTLPTDSTESTTTTLPTDSTESTTTTTTTITTTTSTSETTLESITSDAIISAAPGAVAIHQLVT